jgi:ParB-like chromosome segregation protein Spo0J
MARRKRLTPADPAAAAEDAPAPAASRKLAPMGAPIAQVAGDAATSAALREVTEALQSARAEGRLVLRLPLDAIDAGYLVRDRILTEPEDFASLIASIRARGQQTPIEVVELAGGSFGLISGWRRLLALQELHRETGEPRFETIQALLRRPEAASDAYLAMIEENEIRVGLSYYERARIAAKAAEGGVYASEQMALRALFAAASRAKRSKIGSFLDIYHALDGELRFAAAIPERLGLSLSRALSADPALGPRIAARLRQARPATAEAELALLGQAAAGKADPPAEAQVAESPIAESPAAEAPAGAIHLALTGRGARQKVVLSGPGVTPGFVTLLRAWLADLD